jgi:hypothetical protein
MVYANAYKDDSGVDFLRKANIEILYLPINE